MLLTLKRKILSINSTIGELSVDGKFLCYALEDPIREVKIQNETCIPQGRYRVIIDMSKRFNKLMPHILDVPGFEGVRIHSGNTSKDTEGCILLGLTQGTDFIGQSKDAFSLFYGILEQGLKQGEVYIEIVNEVKGV